MPTDYSQHPLGNPVHGNHPPAPMCPPIAFQKALAEDTNSAQMQSSQTTVLQLVATAKLRIDVKSTTGALDPANAGMVLGANERVFLTLPPGTWFLKTTAYV